MCPKHSIQVRSGLVQSGQVFRNHCYLVITVERQLFELLYTEYFTYPNPLCTQHLRTTDVLFYYTVLISKNINFSHVLAYFTMESVDDIEIPTNVGWYTKFFKPKPDTENRHIFLICHSEHSGKRNNLTNLTRHLSTKYS